MAVKVKREVKSLKKLCPQKSDQINALLQLLVDESGQVTTAVIKHELFESRVFVVSSVGAFVVKDCDGRLWPDQPDAIEQACDILDMADGLLKFIEGRLGIDLDPVAIIDAQNSAFGDETAVIIDLQSGAIRVRLALIVDNAQQELWAYAEENQLVANDFPCRVSIEFEAVRLAVADAADIGGGDLLLLARNALAIISVEPAECQSLPLCGVIDLAEGTYSITDRTYDEKDSSMADDDDSNQSNTAPGQNVAASLMVPVTVRLPALHFGAAALAALGQGSTLSLAPLTQGLQVELLVGGRKIADGEIVEIGDNFGILIAQTAGVSKPAPPHGSTEIPTSDDGEE